MEGLTILSSKINDDSTISNKLGLIGSSNILDKQINQSEKLSSFKNILNIELKGKTLLLQANRNGKFEVVAVAKKVPV